MLVLCLQSIMTISYQRQTARPSRRGAPKEDVEAVRQLPDEIPGALPPQPSDKKGSDYDEP